MNKQKLYDAYENIRPSQAERDRMLEQILSAASCEPLERNGITMKKRNMRRMVAIAAVIAVCLALAGMAYAAGVLGLREVLLVNKPENVLIDHDYDVISLQGLQDSPSYQAASEWFAFDDAYDPDYKILHSVGDDVSIEGYMAYGCYTQEMMDKVDEICEKYGLIKHTGDTDCYTSQELFDAVGIKTLYSSVEAEHDFLWAYYYDDGTFHMEEDLTLTIGDEKTIKVPYQIRCVKKNTLDTSMLNIGQIEDYEQWRYMTASGVELTIATRGDKGLLLVDREEAYITVNILNWSDTLYSKEIMEAIAETFDFSYVS